MLQSKERCERGGWARLVAGACAVLVAGVSAALADLRPTRLYYGVDRPMPMVVELAAGSAGAARVDLLEPGSAKVLASAAVDAGTVDLASVLDLWARKDMGLVYAQLVVGEAKVGPAVVLQPIRNPALAAIDRGAPTGLRFQQTGTEFSGIRAYVDSHVVMETSEGPIEFRLRPDVAPNTAWNFRHLVEGGFYTDIVFHRVIADFVIQAGDPTGTGLGGPGYNIDLENSTLPHDFGVLSMARSTGDPNTNGSQIFVCLKRERTDQLDGKYCAFGQLVRGGEVVRTIAATPLRGERPIDPPVWRSARLVPAPPYEPIQQTTPTTQPKTDQDAGR